jgi:hypothetical protein
MMPDSQEVPSSYAMVVGHPHRSFGLPKTALLTFLFHLRRWQKLAMGFDLTLERLV